MQPLPMQSSAFSAQEVQNMLDLPYPGGVTFGKAMSCREFDSTMQALTLTAAEVRHRSNATPGRKDSFKDAVYNLYQAFEGCRYQENLSNAVQFEFLDKDGKIITNPQWLAFADPQEDPLDGHRIYLSETHPHLKPNDPINK